METVVTFVKRNYVIIALLVAFILVYACVVITGPGETAQSRVRLRAKLRARVRPGDGAHGYAADSKKSSLSMTEHLTDASNIVPGSDDFRTLANLQYSSAEDIDVGEVKPRPRVAQQERRVSLVNVSDIIHMKPLRFLAYYKNPCWFETIPTRDRTREPHGQRKTLRCLPYYIIAGQPKSGTTDLYHALNLHPDTEMCNIKEPHWWTRRRIKPGLTTLDSYVSQFSNAARAIQSDVVLSGGTLLHPRITGEASASTLWDMSYWTELPENNGLNEPKYLTAQYIKHILPDVKIIVILRNPVDRLFSDSVFFNFTASVETFHKHVVTGVKRLQLCFKRRNVQSCLYDSNVTDGLKARLHVGLYYTFLSSWLNIFPRSQLRILQLEEYSRNKTHAIDDIYRFLDIDPLTAREAAVQAKLLSSQPARNSRPAKLRSLVMLNKTRTILEQFYRPFNQQLANLLGDNTFLWE